MNRDRWIALALLLAAWAEKISGGREDLALHLALTVVITAPLGFARRRPWLPTAAAALALLVYGLIGHEPDATGEIFALAGAAFLAGSRMELRAALLALAVLGAAATAHLALLGAATDILFVFGVFLAPPLVFGRAIRGRRRRIEELEALNRQLAEERERSVRLAGEIERARITRDLEAVVAASLEEMIRHARRGERLAGAEAAAAFEAIRQSGAEAAGELRRLLRLLH